MKFIIINKVKRPWILGFILLMLFYQCDKKTYNYVVKIPRDQRLELSEIVSDISYIPLEEKENVYMTVPYKILVHNNHFFVQSHSASRIVIFDSKGNVDGFLNRVGGDENSVKSVSDFCFCSIIDAILVADDSRNRILVYSASSNELMSSTTLNYRPMAMKCHEGRLYIFTSEYSHPIKVLNPENFELVDSIHISNKHMHWLPSHTPFFTNEENELLFVSFASDSLYNLSKPIKSVSFAQENWKNSNQISSEKMSEIIFNTGSNSTIEEAIIPMGYSSHIQNHIAIISLFKPGDLESLIVDFKSKRLYLFSKNMIRDTNLWMHGRMFMSFVRDDETYNYSFIIPDEKFVNMSKKYMEKYDDHISIALKELFEKTHLDTFQNPIVVKYRINFNPILNVGNRQSR